VADEDPPGSGIPAEEIERALKSLTVRERRVLELRYGLKGEGPWTCDEIGRHFGVSWVYIQQVDNQAHRKLREASGSDEDLIDLIGQWNTVFPAKKAGWWERRKRGRRRRKELQERYREEERTLASLAPMELARSLESSDLATRLKGAERTKVAAEIARLSGRDRYILGLAGYYGYSTHDIAVRFFRDLKDVEFDLRRIFKRLRGEEGAGA
jgi:DNA-directed RNA polymerase specialized sigma24 family protein